MNRWFWAAVLGSAVIAVVLSGSTASAGIYDSAEPFDFELDEDGSARPLTYTAFNFRFRELRTIATDTSRDPNAPKNPDRDKVLKRLAAMKSRSVGEMNATEIGDLSSVLLRLGKTEEAINILQGVSRDPRRSTAVVMLHAAQALQLRGDWREAAERHQWAVRGMDMPSAYGKLTAAELKWLKSVETRYYLPWLVHRADEAERNRGKRGQELDDDVDPIFPPSPPRKNVDPLRFKDDRGGFSAGVIAESERSKLPKDAVAVVQQMLYWNPMDLRLYWLLGELYNAEGDIESAARIFDECAELGYSNRKLLEHRRAIKAQAEQLRTAKAAEALAARQREQEAKETAERTEREIKQRRWWIGSAAVAMVVLLVYYQFRETVRRVVRRFTR